MYENDPEPLERLEEIIAHPADTTFNALHDQELAAKKQLAEERRELSRLLAKKPQDLMVQKQIEEIKVRISQKHDELMEILKNEERTSREIQEKRF